MEPSPAAQSELPRPEPGTLQTGSRGPHVHPVLTDRRAAAPCDPPDTRDPAGNAPRAGIRNQRPRWGRSIGTGAFASSRVSESLRGGLAFSCVCKYAGSQRLLCPGSPAALCRQARLSRTARARRGGRSPPRGRAGAPAFTRPLAVRSGRSDVTGLALRLRHDAPRTRRLLPTFPLLPTPAHPNSPPPRPMILLPFWKENYLTSLT